METHFEIEKSGRGWGETPIQTLTPIQVNICLKK